nr:immunoglobulin light chain junction region [Macaca mulatta]MOY06983.1 immunoglobulin light chain junction region [Macaca mulatta]MOY07672.1 immunoglobulin light chain junction region [Macaca mulatta]
DYYCQSYDGSLSGHDVF